MSPDIAEYKRQQEAALLKYEAELIALQQARKRHRIESFFPDVGPVRRELYHKHLKFFEAGGRHSPMPECPPECDGSPHRERCLLAANRTGKTVAASYEVACHATGVYPSWWKGGRFHLPVTVWACNDTNTNVRDINQLELLGPYDEMGTGMVPYSKIHGDPSKKSGIPKAVESFSVKHTTGGLSNIIFKSYESGWEAFTGRAIEVIWCDEEPPQDVYAECCIRTMTTRGLIMLTFTPLQGVTEVVKGFLESNRRDAERDAIEA